MLQPNVCCENLILQVLKQKTMLFYWSGMKERERKGGLGGDDKFRGNMERRLLTSTRAAAQIDCEGRSGRDWKSTRMTCPCTYDSEALVLFLITPELPSAPLGSIQWLILSAGYLYWKPWIILYFIDYKMTSQLVIYFPLSLQQLF